MKKFISIIITIALVFTSGIVAFGDTVNSNNKADTYIAVFDSMGMQISNYEKNASGVSFTTERSFDGKTLVSNMTIREENSDVVVTCVEGHKQDILIIKTDGTLILNGKPVLIETIIPNSINVENTQSSITPLAQRYNKWQMSCPYGSTSNYTVNSGSPVINNLQLEQAIADITVNILITIVADALIRDAANTFITDVLEDMVADSLHDVIDYFEANHPGGNAMSMKTFRRVHVTHGAYIPSLDEYVYRVNIEFYTQTNCNGFGFGSEAGFNVIRT